MAKFNLKLMAMSAEIVASLAVIISLIFVAYSINQNTAALQAINDNFLYELQNQRLSDVSIDGDLATIIVKFTDGQELTDSELLRYRFWMTQELNMWELAFLRFRDGLLPPRQWKTWDAMWSKDIPLQIPVEWWSNYRYQFDTEFAVHVDEAYQKQ